MSIGATIAIPPVFKSLRPKSLDGTSLHLPTFTGSVVDVTLNVKKNVTIQQVNNALIAATGKPELKGILTDSTDPSVSSDIVDTRASSIVGGLSIKVVNTARAARSLVKVFSEDDNEWICRCADIFHFLGNLGNRIQNEFSNGKCQEPFVDCAS
jgi:glyceraldehyde 3-phosphate dehydrogenase